MLVFAQTVTYSQSVQLHITGNLYQEPMVNDGLQTASLGRQQWQDDSPTLQTENNKGEEDPVDSEGIWNTVGRGNNKDPRMGQDT